MSPTTGGAAVIVLGMHRSGTSATSRVLNRMGSWLGSDASVTRRFEHAAVQDTNEGILRALGGRWHTPPDLTDGWTEDAALRAYDAPARAALADLGGHPVFSWKDPRTCFTLPWWEHHLGAPPVVVYVHRHPTEVAASLAARNGFGAAHALMMWEAYNGAALRAAAGHRVITMPYSQLVDAPTETAAVLHEALTHWGLPLTADPESATARLLAADPFHLTHDVLAASIEHQLADLRRRRAEQQAKFPPATGPVSPLGPADQGAGSGAG